MRVLRRSLGQHGIVLVPIILAFAYGVFERVFDQGIDSHVTASQLILYLASNSRLQLFVVLPSWLIATAFAIARSRTPQELVRYGSWRATILRPLWRCLLGFAGISVLVVILWLPTLWGTFRGAESSWQLITAFIALFAEIPLVGLVLACLFLLVSAIHLTMRSVASLVVVPVLIWAWAAAADVGLVPPNSLANLSLYMSIDTVAARPFIALVLGVVTVAAFSLCWLIANYWDELSSRHSAGLTRRVLVPILGLGLAALGSVGSGIAPRSISDSLVHIYYGTGGLLTQYLFGMTVLLLYAWGAAANFASDWCRLFSPLLIRYGTYGHWLRDVLGREMTRSFAYAAALVAIPATVRLLFRGVEADWIQAGGVIFLVLAKLYLACLCFFILLIAAVVLFNSDIAVGAVVATILCFGLLPFNASPWFPVTAWSMSWSGQEVLPACIALFAGVGIATVLLFTAARFRRGWGSNYADR